MTKLTAHGATEKERVLWMALFTQGVNGRRGIPYVLIGEPGAAKTSKVSQISKRADLPFEGVLGSLRSPLDYLGVPIPHQMSTADCLHLDPDMNGSMLTMHYAPAGFSVRAAKAQNSLILFDEANTMPQNVQAAMLRVLFEGVVGELQLPPGVRMLLAMNATEDAAGGWELSPAMANRMGWLEWDPPTADGFTTYLINGCNPDVEVIDRAAEEQAFDAIWASEAWPAAAGLTAGFIARRPNMLHQKPNAADGAKPWASARTWEFATRALAGSMVYGLSEKERDLAVSAFIGAGVYSEFYTWMKSADLPDPKELLDGQVTFKHNPARLDRTAAVLAACSALVLPKDAEKRADRTGKLWEVLDEVVKESVDIAVPSVANLCQARLMIGYSTAYQMLGKMDPVLQAAGITRPQ